MSTASEPAAVAATARPKGAIHDLGYKRYVGSRRPQSTRWRVIMRHQLAHGWKTWWRYKMWVGFAVVATIIVGAIMVVIRSKTTDAMLHGQARILMPLVDLYVFGSIEWYCRLAFLATLTVGAGVVASDLKTGAFTFYFARPVRPMDYVLGKLTGLFLLQSFILLIPLLVITLVRLGLSETTDELIKNLEYVPKALMIGTIGSLTYASASLGFSALMDNPRQTTALWAGLYIIGGYILIGIGFASHTPEIGAIDIAAALQSFAYRLYDFEPLGAERLIAPIEVAVVSLLLWTCAGVGLAYWRVRATGSTGIGGGS